MTVNCNCNNPVGSGIISQTLPTCKDCIESCGTELNPDCAVQENVNKAFGILGLSIRLLTIYIIISVIILILVVWFSMNVMRKCKGKPGWLNPTIITLLVLWLLIGWFPPLGFTFFIILIIILLVFNNKCNRRR